MKTLAKALALALILPAALDAQTPSLDGTHLYSPATNLEQSELEMLHSAKRSVDIAMYSFTDRELAEELVELARSGVKIRVYRDRTEYQHEIERSDLNTTAISMLVTLKNGTACLTLALMRRPPSQSLMKEACIARTNSEKRQVLMCRLLGSVPVAPRQSGDVKMDE